MSLLLRMTTTAGQVGAPALSGSEMAFLTPHSCKSSEDFKACFIHDFVCHAARLGMQ
jgi:hypothetical protein